MKKLIIALITVPAISLLGFVTFDFPGWPALVERSRDIAVVRVAQDSEAKSPPDTKMAEEFRGFVLTKIETVAILKGSTNSPLLFLKTAQNLPQSENFLVFGQSLEGQFQAFEDYRIVPLGKLTFTNDLSTIGLQDQIRLLLGSRSKDLSDQISKLQREKDRLDAYSISGR